MDRENLKLFPEEPCSDSLSRVRAREARLGHCFSTAVTRCTLEAANISVALFFKWRVLCQHLDGLLALEERTPVFRFEIFIQCGGNIKISPLYNYNIEICLTLCFTIFISLCASHLKKQKMKELIVSKSCTNSGGKLLHR